MRGCDWCRSFHIITSRLHCRARGCCRLKPLHGATGSGSCLDMEEGISSWVVVVRYRLPNIILVSP